MQNNVDNVRAQTAHTVATRLRHGLHGMPGLATVTEHMVGESNWLTISLGNGQAFTVHVRQVRPGDNSGPSSLFDETRWLA